MHRRRAWTPPAERRGGRRAAQGQPDPQREHRVRVQEALDRARPRFVDPGPAPRDRLRLRHHPAERRRRPDGLAGQPDRPDPDRARRGGGGLDRLQHRRLAHGGLRGHEPAGPAVRGPRAAPRVRVPHLERHGRPAQGGRPRQVAGLRRPRHPHGLRGQRPGHVPVDHPPGRVPERHAQPQARRHAGGRRRGRDSGASSGDPPLRPGGQAPHPRPAPPRPPLPAPRPTPRTRSATWASCATRA